MRILVIKLSSIGDIVHALPAVALLRRSLPTARISWVVDGAGASVLEGSPAIDQLINLGLSTLGKRPRDRDARRQFFASVSAMRRCGASGSDVEGNGSKSLGRADVVIDFQGLLKSGVIASVSGSSNRVGSEDCDLRERGSKLFLTEQVKTAHFAHVIDKNIALACCAIKKLNGGVSYQGNGAPDQAYEFPIAVSREDESHVDRILEGRSRFAILNPGGGWKTKLWEPERYAEVGDWLWSNCGIESVVTYGPREERLAYSVASNSRSGKVQPVASTLKQYVALARRAVLFVGGDTGPLHLAAASRTPIVGLYGPTSPERNGPFDRNDVTVGRDLWCRADCHRRKCWHWECMDIPVSDIKSAIETRLGRAAVKEASVASD